jgi:hypothetical protein
MEKENIEELFNELQGSFDLEEPSDGHQQRFLDKLNRSNDVIVMDTKRSYWKPLAIAASFALIAALSFGYLNTTPTTQEQLAEISPEASASHLYFAALIEEQVKELESEGSPDTQRLIDDTMIQLNKLETNYQRLEQDLLNGGNSQLILGAMITNFQTRIDLLQEVMTKIENIKNLKNQNDENYTI